MKFQLKQDDLIRQLDELAKKNREIRLIIKKMGYPKSRRKPCSFKTLADIVIGQQVNTKAAQSISTKLNNLCGNDLTPQEFLRIPEDVQISIGLSRQKRRYINALARRIIDGHLSILGLRTASDKSVFNQITSVIGFGPWSAQMYLIFSLGRIDIWPAGDLGVRSGLAKIFNLGDRPSEKEADSMGDRFKPYRSSLALLAWHSLENAP